MGGKGRTRISVQRSSFMCQALVLTPSGNGTTDHLDERVAAPKEIELSDGQFELGREEPAQIVIPYPTVSSKHAMIKIAGESVSVTDLNSTNGVLSASRSRCENPGQQGVQEAELHTIQKFFAGTFIDDNELMPMEAETLSIGQSVTFGDTYLAQYKLEKRGD